jgi:isocitrate/isopropylmalate dehydrogenase
MQQFYILPAMPRRYRIAVIPGDGIGHEVVPAGQAAADAAANKHGFAIDWQAFDWSCERYARTGQMMPDDGLDQLRAFDAIFLGAVGFPGVPDHISLWGLLLPIRRGFHQYVNLRPRSEWCTVPAGILRFAQDDDVFARHPEERSDEGSPPMV